MEEFIQWWSVNGFNVVSIIFSGIISLIISAVYYHKGNRNNLQMTMLFPIVRFLNEQYTRKNYRRIIAIDICPNQREEF